MRKTYLAACVAVTFAAALAGCGGSGGGEAPVTDPGVQSDVVPDSAMASPEALVRYAIAMQAETDENDEPLRMPAREMPSSETAEPVPLD